MQKLNELEKWKVCKSGDQIVLPSNKRRQVRLHVNAGVETRLFIKPEGKGDPIFLALVKGLDVIEFVATGPVTIVPDDRINFCTSEGEKVYFEETAESFTKLITRQPRNYELEIMMAKAEQNVSRRMESMMRQQAEHYERMMADAKADDKSESDPINAGEPAKPKPDDGQQKSGEATGEEGESNGEPKPAATG